MKLIYGDIKNPTGNAIIFWGLKKKSKLFKNAKILASNFVISALQLKNETLVVNFPPVLIERYEDLIKIAKTNKIDLIKGEGIELPEDINNFNEFYRSQIDKYNDIITEYLIAFKEKNQPSRETKSLPQLINIVGETMESVRRLVKDKGNHDTIQVKIKMLEDIQEDLDKEMKGFDLHNIIHLIDRPDAVVDRLVDLYKKKFLAIFLENYEQADILKREINKIKRSLSP
jgi:hypothetical protein